MLLARAEQRVAAWQRSEDLAHYTAEASVEVELCFLGRECRDVHWSCTLGVEDNSCAEVELAAPHGANLTSNVLLQ